MAAGATNFAYLMDLLGISTAALCEATGADKSLVSRWRSGKRKLMEGHHWADDIAAHWVQAEKQLRHPVLSEVLRVYYPSLPIETDDEKRRALALWLSSAGQRTEAYQQERHGMLGFLMGKNPKPSRKPKPVVIPEPPELPDLNKATFGIGGFRSSAITFFDLVLALPEPQEMLFVCPDGLDMITREERFAGVVMDKLMELFAKGHTFSVVIRTDYKISDIAEFSGRWLVAHLLGYIKSYYYDDFKSGHTEKMLIAVKGHMAGRVTDGEADGAHGMFSTMHFDAPTIDQVYRQCSAIQAQAKQRFHYSLFERPMGFLRGLAIPRDEPSYLFAMMPHFGVAPRKRIASLFALSDEDNRLVARDFAPLFTDPTLFDERAPVRHMFCEEAIEIALLKKWHTCPELGAILSRRVCMRGQGLVDQLLLIKKFMATHRNYEVCFVPQSVFDKFMMQIGTWGSSCAIGWVAGGKSTACRDFQSVAALHGFCEMVWGKIPAPLRSRTAANHKLNMWMKKAAKYGYTVE